MAISPPPPAWDHSDVAPSRRLTAALKELDVKVRVPGFADPGEVKIDADYLTPFTTLALRTSHGDLDVSFAPDAPGRWSFSYEELAARAVVIDVGIEIPVADLDEVIGSKEAAGRAKDLEDLARLYLVRDERRRHGRPSMDTTPP